MVVNAFMVGAVEYVLKDNIGHIPNIIRSVNENRFSPIKILGRKCEQLQRDNLLNILTASERAIFHLIEAGYTHSEIQDKLTKTKSTLKTQIKSVLVKLDAKNTKEAVRKVRFGVGYQHKSHLGLESVTARE